LNTFIHLEDRNDETAKMKRKDFKMQCITVIKYTLYAKMHRPNHTLNRNLALYVHEQEVA